MYSVNETVLYGADGVCTITAIVEKTVLGETRSFYELHPVNRQDAVLFLYIQRTRKAFSPPTMRRPWQNSARC